MTSDNGQDQTLIVVSQHYFPESTATAQLVTDLVSELISRGRSVHVITASPNSDSEESGVSRSHQYQRHQTILISKLLSGLHFVLFVLTQLSRFQGPNNTLLIVSNPPFLVLIGPLIKNIYNLNFIYLYQDLFPRSAILSGMLPSKGVLTNILSTVLKHSYSRASRIILLSHDMKSRFIRENGAHRSINVIPNWSVLNSDSRSMRPNPLLAEYGLSGKFVIQYSGNLGRLHDILTILEAARILQHNPFIHFVFIGSGPKKEQVLRYIQHNPHPNITIKDFVPRSQLAISLDACDASLISLIPGAEECVAPSKLYGILASAKPVLLISRTHSFLSEELSSKQICLSSEPGDPIGLANNITKLFHSPELAAQMGRKAFQYYSKTLGKKSSIDQYERLIFHESP